MKFMRDLKKIAALMSASVLAAAASGCAGSAGEQQSSDTSSYTEQVSVPDPVGEDPISAIPDGAPTELEWLSYFDINPTSSAQEKRVDLTLFENKGGSIKYTPCASTAKYDQLANRVLSNDPPDLFWYEQKMTFPCYCVKGMFQPVDDIVDFSDPMWADMKDLADTFVLGGKHYVCPINLDVLSVLTYDKNVISANNLDDPYDLYMEGNWTWDTWYDLMDDYCSQAEGDETRFGVNGWFAPFIFQSTGKTLIAYDEEKDEYYANIADPDFDRASTLLYDIRKNDLYYPDWVGSASDAFKKNILFYAMGTWAVTPKEGDEWGIVPMPRDPNTDNNYTTIGITAYMWVSGSEKADAVKCWYECAKAANSGEYVDIGREKFFVTQPYWTEEMFDMSTSEVLSSKYIKVVDPGYGISTLLSNDDAATNPTKEAVIPYMYSSVMKTDDDGTQYTWTQLRETYLPTIESELKDFNAEYKAFIGK